ncbi:hypothetical protein FACS1894127_1910 [Clostridia bacterium]|nr:hypothetical protein FACS1894127_1910 [Clostridia bacterium]
MYMELKNLDENRFTKCPMEENPQEEAFAHDWEELLGHHYGLPWQLLREMCVELCFPVSEGQSENPEFLTALKRGILPSPSQWEWIPVAPEEIRIYLHPTPVGRVPVIECDSDLDFIHLQQSLVHRCEPIPIPDSRGATIIKNYNNWARVRMHLESGAMDVFKSPALYRDHILLLSHRNYSGVSAEAFGLERAEWRRKSLVIRREHEAAHYMTERYYHSSKNEIHDEIIADFMGLTAAFGDYDPIKFLTFLGLENYPKYRVGGRLEIYLSRSDDGFDPLCETLVQLTKNIAIYFNKSGLDRMDMFHTMCRTSVADMERGKFT